MKQILILVFLLSIFSQNTNAQLFEYNYAAYYKIYVDGANVRQQPSLSAKVVGKLTHNTNIASCDGANSHRDTIGGVADYWLPFNFENSIAYVWGGVFADAAFRTHANIDDYVLVDFSSKHELGFKVFNNNKLIHEASFSRPDKKGAVSAGTIGKTYNSNGEEVFGIIYNDRSYELFNWDGKKISESKVILRDESFITGKLDTFEFSLIHGNKVNIRENASVESKVIATLANNSYVKLITKDAVLDTVNNERGYWHKIFWNDKEAYVWNRFLAMPIQFLKSNKEKDIDFLFTTESIAVLRNGKIITELDVPFNYNATMLYELGNMGFKQNYNFIAKYIEGHGCGTDSGDDYYVWDGTKLKHFGYSYGVGDAGISFGNTLTFPSSKGGINNLIIAEKYDGESLDIPSFEMCGEGYEFVYYSMSNQTLKYASDTLFEVPSIDLSLRNLVSKEFPKHSMQHYTFGDINKDGIDDALFFCVIQTDDYDYEPTSPMVGVAYGNSTGGFDLATHNTSIVQEGFVGVVLNILKEGVQVKSIYNVGYSSEGNELPHMSIFDFIYNKSDKQLSWNSITKAEAESDDYNAKWVNNVSYFKTKKISFEAAWGDSGNDE